MVAIVNVENSSEQPIEAGGTAGREQVPDTALNLNVLSEDGGDFQ